MAIVHCNTDIVYLVLVNWLCTVGGCAVAGGCAGGEGGCFGDVCFCVGAVSMCDGGVGKLTCRDVVSLWGRTYSCKTTSHTSEDLRTSAP